MSGEARWCPIYKWGQSREKLYVTLFVPCLTEEAVHLHIAHNSIDFYAERIAQLAGSNEKQRHYKLHLDLLAEIDEEKSTYFLRHDHVRLEIVKRKPVPWRTLQLPHIPKNKNERPDFDHVGDDDSDDEVLCRDVSSSKKTGARAAAKTAPSRLEIFVRKWGVNVWSAISKFNRWELPLMVTPLVYVAICPFNKVEESFNLQATHDLLFHRGDLSAYDHHLFPGVVPRSFIGPTLLAAASSPAVLAISLLGIQKLYAQALVRCTLALCSGAALVAVQRATRRQFKTDAARAFSILCCVQFHWMFYASRTLPNTFAGVLVTFATATWIDGKVELPLALLTVAGVIFRAELIILLGPLALLFLVQSKVALLPLLRLGFSTAAVACVATVVVDSIFWRRLLWPEAEVLYFNTILNKSKDYGTSPAHWYFTSALPRALLIAYPLALASLYTTPRARQLVAVPLIFVAIYSILPHKELRFILYVVPALNVAGATALAKLHQAIPKLCESMPQRRALTRLGKASLALLLLICLSVTAVFTVASRSNYPGGKALLALHEYHANMRQRSSSLQAFGLSHLSFLVRSVNVHIGVEAAMSGVSRFLELPPPWRYSKKEGLNPEDFRAKGFMYALVGSRNPMLPGYSRVMSVNGFAGLQLSYPFLRYENQVDILQRVPESTSRIQTNDDFIF